MDRPFTSEDFLTSIQKEHFETVIHLAFLTQEKANILGVEDFTP